MATKKKSVAWLKDELDRARQKKDTQAAQSSAVAKSIDSMSKFTAADYMKNADFNPENILATKPTVGTPVAPATQNSALVKGLSSVSRALDIPAAISGKLEDSFSFGLLPKLREALAPGSTKTVAEAAQRHPVSAAIGESIGYLAPFGASYKLASAALKSAGVLKGGSALANALTKEVLAAHGVGTVEGGVRGEGLSGSMKRAQEYGALSLLGTAALHGLGTVASKTVSGVKKLLSPKTGATPKTVSGLAESVVPQVEQKLPIKPRPPLLSEAPVSTGTSRIPVNEVKEAESLIQQIQRVSQNQNVPVEHVATVVKKLANKSGIIKSNIQNTEKILTNAIDEIKAKPATGKKITVGDAVKKIKTVTSESAPGNIESATGKIQTIKKPTPGTTPEPTDVVANAKKKSPTRAIKAIAEESKKLEASREAETLKTVQETLKGLDETKNVNASGLSTDVLSEAKPKPRPTKVYSQDQPVGLESKVEVKIKPKAKTEIQKQVTQPAVQPVQTERKNMSKEDFVRKFLENQEKRKIARELEGERVKTAETRKAPRPLELESKPGGTTMVEDESIIDSSLLGLENKSKRFITEDAAIQEAKTALIRGGDPDAKISVKLHPKSKPESPVYVVERLSNGKPELLSQAGRFKQLKSGVETPGEGVSITWKSARESDIKLSKRSYAILPKLSTNNFWKVPSYAIRENFQKLSSAAKDEVLEASKKIGGDHALDKAIYELHRDSVQKAVNLKFKIPPEVSAEYPTIQIKKAVASDEAKVASKEIFDKFMHPGKRPTITSPSKFSPEDQVIANPKLQYSTETKSLIKEKISQNLKSKIKDAPISRTEIVDFVKKTFDIPVEQGKFKFKDSVLGVFKAKPEVVRLKAGKDIDTMYHEIGHFLDKKLRIQTYLDKSGLEVLGRATTPASKLEDKLYLQKEGVAELVRRYLIDKDWLKENFPMLYDQMDGVINSVPNLKSTFESLSGFTQNYIHQTPSQRLMGNISIGKDTTKTPFSAKKLFEKFYSEAFDDLTYLDNAVKGLAGDKKILPTENPYLLAMKLRNIAGKAETFLKYGVVDKNYKKIGQSFEEVLRPVINSKKLNEFREYAVARRAFDLNAREIETGLDLDDIKNVLEKHSQDQVSLKLFNDALAGLSKYSDNLLKDLVNSGYLSAQTYDAIKRSDSIYVPFYRVFEKLTRSAVKEIEGSTRDIIDPLESIVKNTYFFSMMGERNKMLRALANLANKTEGSGKIMDRVPPEMIPTDFKLSDIKTALEEAGADLSGTDLSHIATIFKPTGYKNDTVVSLFRNGKAEYWQIFDKDLYKTLSQFNSGTSNTIIKILSYPTKVLRSGITLSPEYSSRNIVRDAVSAFIFSKHGFVPGVDTVRGMFHALKKDELYYTFLSSGAGQTTMNTLDRKFLQKNMRELLGKAIEIDKRTHAYNIITSPTRALRAISEVFEISTRLGEFEKGVVKLKKLGMSPADAVEQAAADARDMTIDFTRHGTLGKEMNKIIAFFNPALQGSDKLVRAFKENPVGITGKIVSAVTLPSILLHFLNRDDKRYQELPQWQKDLFWIIPTPEGKPLIRIPKPLELGILFGTFPERVLDYVGSRDPRALDNLGKQLLSTMLPGALPTAMLPIIENMVNYSFFYERPIVPSSEVGIRPSEQYGQETSTPAIYVGKLLGVSPRKIENFVRGYGGEISNYVLKIIDAAIGKKQFMGSDVTTMPIIKAFTAKGFSLNSNSVQRFYADLAALESEYSTQVHTGKIKVIDQFSDRNKLREMRRTKVQLSELRSKIKTIQLSKQDNHTKQQKIDKIILDIVNISRKQTKTR